MESRGVLLAQDDAAFFYRAWGATIAWVNEKRQVVPPFPPPTPGNPIDPSLAIKVRNTLWGDDALLGQFLSEGARDLGNAERELVASWRFRIVDQFLVFKHLRKHSILIGGGNVYGVLGIYTPLEVVLPYVPSFANAVLLPFRDKIIIDGLLETPSVHISFGGGARRLFKNDYDRARASSSILTSLPVAQTTGAGRARPK